LFDVYLRRAPYVVHLWHGEAPDDEVSADGIHLHDLPPLADVLAAYAASAEVEREKTGRIRGTGDMEVSNSVVRGDAGDEGKHMDEDVPVVIAATRHSLSEPVGDATMSFILHFAKKKSNRPPATHLKRHWFKLKTKPPSLEMNGNEEAGEKEGRGEPGPGDA
jgi:hypothetical protein